MNINGFLDNYKYVFDPAGLYGGNQNTPKDDSRRFESIVKKYHSEYTETDVNKCLLMLSKEGCGYVALINSIFLKFYGEEEHFEKIFGYPMHLPDGRLNFDDLLVDFYCATDNHNGFLGFDFVDRNEDAKYENGYGTTIDSTEWRFETYGSFVGKGQILATMDAAQLDQTRLKLVNDSTELARLRSLYEEGGVSKSDFDAVEMAYNVSRRSYNNLAENTYLRSPISGVVTARNYDRGDLYAGQPIFVVQQITPVKLKVGVSEADYTKVKIGNQVEITVDALPGQTFTGKINKIYPTMDATTHTFITEILVQNSDRVLRPGMFARVKVEFGVNNSIVVPEESVVKMQGTGQRCVYVLKPDNTVESFIVKLGRHIDGRYEILEGLSEGDVVTVKGSTSLKDGAKVEVSNK